MSSAAVYMYFVLALAAMFCKLVPEYKKFLVKGVRMVVKLGKALCRCIASAKLWYQHLKDTLEVLGSVPNREERFCFIRGAKGMQCIVMHCIVIVYVDDLLVTRKDGATIARVIETLKSSIMMSRNIWECSNRL